MRKMLIGVVGLGVLFLWTSAVWATVGGPSYVTDVRYDASERTIYFVRDMAFETDWPPAVHALRVGGAQETVVRAVTRPGEAGGIGEDERWKDWSARLDRLPRLQASMGFQARLKTMGMRSDTAGTEWWGPVERRITLLEIEAGKLVGRARITSYGDHRIRVVRMLDVPGGRKLVILRARGIPHEGGYDVDTAVLLTPMDAPAASPPAQTADAGDDDALFDGCGQFESRPAVPYDTREVQFVVVGAMHSRANAERIAARAAHELAIRTETEFDGFRSQPRGRFDPGTYVTVERSDDYARLRPGLFVVIIGSGDQPGRIRGTLGVAREVFPDAYVFRDSVYFGCMH